MHILVLYYSLKKPISTTEEGIDCVAFFGLIRISVEQSLQTFEKCLSNYYVISSCHQASFTNYLKGTRLRQVTVTTKMWPTSSNPIVRS